MKQLIQDLSNGKTDLIETAMPQCKKSCFNFYRVIVNFSWN